MKSQKINNKMFKKMKTQLIQIIIVLKKKKIVVTSLNKIKTTSMLIIILKLEKKLKTCSKIKIETLKNLNLSHFQQKEFKLWNFNNKKNFLLQLMRNNRQKCTEDYNKDNLLPTKFNRVRD